MSYCRERGVSTHPYHYQTPRGELNFQQRTALGCQQLGKLNNLRIKPFDSLNRYSVLSSSIGVGETTATGLLRPPH